MLRRISASSNNAMSSIRASGTRVPGFKFVHFRVHVCAGGYPSYSGCTDLGFIRNDAVTSGRSRSARRICNAGAVLYKPATRATILSTLPLY